MLRIVLRRPCLYLDGRMMTTPERPRSGLASRPRGGHDETAGRPGGGPKAAAEESRCNRSKGDRAAAVQRPLGRPAGAKRPRCKEMLILKILAPRSETKKKQSEANRREAKRSEVEPEKKTTP